jgi:hypothetical protein
MGLTFKYKNLSSLSYAPGQARAGADGEKGKQGKTGNTVYFIDYDLDNSYTIQLALQKIENNQILSSTSDKKIDNQTDGGRPYKENDIILSSSGNVYKIVLAKQTSAQNYKFDIEKLGIIHDQISANIGKGYITNLTNYEDVSENTLNSDANLPERSYLQRSLILNNSTESTIDSPISENDKVLPGVWIGIALEAILPAKPDVDYITAITNNYTYTLTIYLNNKKSYQGDTPPYDEGESEHFDPTQKELYRVFNFYKKLEFTKLNIDTQHGNNPSSTVFYNVFFIPANEMDDLHPSGNDIRFTLSNDSEMIWFKTGNGTSYPGGELSLNKGAFVFPYNNLDSIDSIIDFDKEGYTKCDLTNMKYYYNLVYDAKKDSTIDSTVFPKYAVGGSLSGLKNEVETAFNSKNIVISGSDDNNLIQFSKRYIHFDNDNTSFAGVLTNNVRGGDSAYFSSIREEKNSLSITENGKIISKEMFRYIANLDNKFVLSIKNNNTKEVVYYDIPVSFQ